jgi:outer membrane protein assembly factor BamD
MRNPALWIFLLIGLTFSACSSYEKVLKSDDINLKEKKAMDYYAAKDYYKALPLFEELISTYKGTEKAEAFYYYYSYCHYYIDELLLAAYNFKNFSQTYPGSKYAEESLFMNAKCYVEMSPRESLDQDNSTKAINELQLFINTYPQSTRVAEANGMIDAMRRKLEKKDYQAAKLYYDMDDYKAAAVAFTNLLKKYPDTPMADEISYMALKSSYLYAVNSIDAKKPERLEQTMAAYDNFNSRFPQSKFASDAKEIDTDAVRLLDKLKTKTES